MNRNDPRTLRIVAGLGIALATVSFAPSALADDRYAAFVMDARTNEVLLNDQADEIRFPASLTKMMTLYMLFEALERGDLTLQTRMTASRTAARMPASRLGLRRGDTLTVEQAIRALAIQSANDVAVMVAEHLGGTEARFSSQMTARARELGMTNTRFVNASGWPDPRMRATARDMATLGQALWRDFPEYYHYFEETEFTYGRREIRGHNRLLGSIEGVDGIKTGYTRASGYNLVTSADRGGRRVIVVVMGGATAAARDAQVAHLLEGAYQEFARRELDGGDVTFANLPTTRLDVQFQAAGQGGVNTVVSPAGPQGVVVPVLSPRTGLLPPAAPMEGQGDETESMDEDGEAPIATAH